MSFDIEIDNAINDFYNIGKLSIIKDLFAQLGFVEDFSSNVISIRDLVLFKGDQDQIYSIDEKNFLEDNLNVEFSQMREINYQIFLINYGLSQPKLHDSVFQMLLLMKAFKQPTLLVAFSCTGTIVAVGTTENILSNESIIATEVMLQKYSVPFISDLLNILTMNYEDVLIQIGRLIYERHMTSLDKNNIVPVPANLLTVDTIIKWVDYVKDIEKMWPELKYNETNYLMSITSAVTQGESIKLYTQEDIEEMLISNPEPVFDHARYSDEGYQGEQDESDTHIDFESDLFEDPIKLLESFYV